jgi:S-adenosylmethionine:tRNA ribosyltransferase-isomerase
VRVSEFDFVLPPELIAQTPPPRREESRLMVLDRATGRLTHAHTRDLPGFVAPGDLIVVNDTRVFPARLRGRRLPGGGRVECLLLRRLDADTWDALVHPGQKLRDGSRVEFERGGVRLQAEIVGRHFFGRRTMRLTSPDGADVERAIDALGDVPLPPYIKRPPAAEDRERYQTVYARVRGSVAAPTAGLHLTPETLEAIRARGASHVAVTLHVGYGTFQPIRSDTVEGHRLEPEPWTIEPAAAAAVNAALDARRRIIAVGTTTTRTLEAVAAGHGGRLAAGSGEAGLFIYPGYRFAVVSALLTNFHLPRSSLLMLVAAFAGRERLLDAYREAVAHRYRFYSYGDAMLIL